MLKDFQNPGEFYRIKPFWFWNGDMNPAEIRHQIHEMKAKGLGGFFLCARQGLTVPYLSDQWFEACKVAVEAAKEEGLEVWLYDEYPYPSGMSGGEVTLQHPEAVHTYMVSSVFSVKKGEEVYREMEWAPVLYAKAIPELDGKPQWEQAIDITGEIGIIQTQQIYQRTGLTAYNDKRYFSYGPQKTLSWKAPEEAESYRVVVVQQKAIDDFKYYGTFLDPCNREAVKTFLETTHEGYRKAIGQYFGTVVKGMFSDETGFLSQIPWSNQLPEPFEKKYGYSILDHLAALHCADYPNARKIRYDFYQLAHEIFRSAYHEQIAQWCNENHLLYCTEVPSMRGTTQLYSTVPGGDCAHEKLGKELDWMLDKDFSNYRSNAKQVSSWKRQNNVDYAMIESFHSVGWSMTIQDAKWMLDKLAIFGVNLYNFHAYYYTIDGITKHDAPPSQFLQNPYWKHYRQLGDYVGRLGAWVTGSETTTRIAVLDPVTSQWVRLGNPLHGFHYGGTDPKEQQELECISGDWLTLLKAMIYSHIEYEHLDAERLPGAVIENGTIQVGRAVYDTLVIPPITTLENCAVEALEKFIAQGGKVVSFGVTPYENIQDQTDIDSVSQRLLGMAGSQVKDGYFNATASCEVLHSGNTAFVRMPAHISTDEMMKLVEKTLRREDDILLTLPAAEVKQVIMGVRENQDGRYVMITNQGKDAFACEIFDPKATSWYECSFEDGSVRRAGEGKTLKVSFDSFQSRIFCAAEGESPLQTEALEAKKEAVEKITVSTIQPMHISPVEHNICRLEYFDVALDGKHYPNVAAGTFIEQFSIHKMADSENISFTQSFGTPKMPLIHYPLEARYTATFTVETMPSKLALLFENRAIMGKHTISINGTPIPADRFVPTLVTDFNNTMADIHDLVKLGENVLTVDCTIEASWHGVSDPLYLMGDFGVVGKTCLTRQPEQAVFMPGVVEGFPYYSGELTFTGSFEAKRVSGPVEIRLDKAIYDCVEVLVNGESLGTRVFTPYCWTVQGEKLHDGKNSITIKVTNTLANMLDGRYFDYEAHKLVEI